MKIGRTTAFAMAGACLVVGAAFADGMGDATFEMPRDIVSAATAFEGYMQNAAGIGTGFSGGESVARSLKSAAAYEPAQLEEGMIAYGAIAALQDDGFVEGVDRAAGRGEARQAFAEQLIEDPYAATRIEGATGALRRVQAALAAKSGPLVSAATQVKGAAYSVQHQAWSKVFVAHPEDRLAEVKRLSAARADPSSDDNAAMMSRLAGADPRDSQDDAPASAVEARALSLAAESVLGRARGADRERLSPLLTEASSAQCLRMAKLNLYQCMAVAGPQYEDIFCMGQHAMYDTGQCVDAAAHGGQETRWASAYAQRTGAGAYTPLVAHHPLRVDPN
jgi:hypothetical protein